MYEPRVRGRCAKDRFWGNCAGVLAAVFCRVFPPVPNYKSTYVTASDYQLDLNASLRDEIITMSNGIY